MVAPPAGTAGWVVDGAGEPSTTADPWATADPVDPRGVRVVDVVAGAGRVGGGVMLTVDGSTACFVRPVVPVPLVVVAVVVEVVVAALVDVVAQAGGTNVCVVQDQRKP
jgi:hypothetical protein